MKTKKYLPFVVFLVLTLTVVKTANAATTLFWGEISETAKWLMIEPYLRFKTEIFPTPW